MTPSQCFAYNRIKAMITLYPQTVFFIKKAYSKEPDQLKLIKKISNKFCISEQSAKAWIQQVVGVV